MHDIEIWLVRHGPNDLGGSEALDRDRSLTPRGIVQVQRIADRLKRDGEKPRVILSSIFNRTMETSDILGKTLDVRVVPTTELCPWHPLLPFLKMLAVGQCSGPMIVTHHTGMQIMLDEIGDGVAPSTLSCGEVRRYKLYLCEAENRWKACLCYRITPVDVGMKDMIT